MIMMNRVVINIRVSVSLENTKLLKDESSEKMV